MNAPHPTTGSEAKGPSDLLAAILAHASSGNQNNQGSQNNQGNGGYPPSEANAVIQKFSAMSATDQQAILDFLRSL